MCELRGGHSLEFGEAFCGGVPAKTSRVLSAFALLPQGVRWGTRMPCNVPNRAACAETRPGQDMESEPK